MRPLLRALWVAAAVSLATGLAYAAPITFTFEGLITGDLETSPQYTSFSSAQPSSVSLPALIPTMFARCLIRRGALPCLTKP